MLRVKRSRQQVENEDENTHLSSLEGDLKKVKISYTPGELMLQKDMNVLRVKFHLKVTMGDHASACIIHFPLTEHQGVRFLFTVARYYPHNAPTVKCLDYSMVLPHIDINGNVTHRALNEDWSAICTIETVLQALDEVCKQIRYSLGYR